MFGCAADPTLTPDKIHVTRIANGPVPQGLYGRNEFRAWDSAVQITRRRYP